ncbi:DUF1127 domain-containing protein [uncultured Sulfitobacter sp.]|uniref:DUF1127 domain-containing protein n=1 Tax=uncultured Sulfitobacter sp. TaxID=191468 RepID=UPI00260D20B1|nr:DUF1127 domain-containing protein [uncultured Sulfitobacter sp.]
MTYQNTSEPFASQTAGKSIVQAAATALRYGASAFGRFLASIGDSHARAINASGRVSKIAALQAKSDAELAELGLTRDNIVHYVFSDLYYT